MPTLLGPPFDPTVALCPRHRATSVLLSLGKQMMVRSSCGRYKEDFEDAVQLQPGGAGLKGDAALLHYIVSSLPLEILWHFDRFTGVPRP